MNTPNSAPSTAASKSASAKKMFGDLPPSSSEIFFSVSAAPRMIVLPTSALPVNAILSTSGCSTIAAPAVSPSPVTMLTTPGGRPASAKLEASCERGQRRLLGRLQHRRAAGADRRRELPRRHQQRVVPRDDLAGDADRLAQREAHRVVGHRDHVAVDLGGQAAVVLEAGGDVGDVELGFDDRLAGVARFELGELVGAVAHDLRQLEQHAAAVLRGGVLPRALVERRARGLHGAVDVGGVASGTRAMTSVVAGSITSSVAADRGATNSPLM